MEALQSDFGSALVQDLLGRFRSLIIDEAHQAVQFNVEEELNKLLMKLSTAHVLLDRFQLSTNNTWQHWIGNVTRLCYDVEDLLDDVLISADNSSIIHKIMSCISRGGMARKILDLHTRLDKHINGLETIHKLNQKAHQCLPEYELLEVGNEVFPEKLYGRDVDKENIVTMLLQENTTSLALLGIDGLGKTALAQYIFSDSRIRAYFDNLVWVSLRQKFDLFKVMEWILKRRFECGYSFETIQDSIHDLCKGKNILIVLDDLWEVKYTEWSLFCSLFLKNVGCKVLVTTCNINATKVTTSKPYYLKVLSDVDCEAIIINKAYSENLSEWQLEMLKIVARSIAPKCNGLPLVAIVLGLWLASNSNDHDWVNIVQRDVYDLRVFKDKVYPTFRFNNPELASYLKRCLAYLSLFPLGYAFNRDKLIQLWIAKGYVSEQGTTRVEDVGYDYFEELLARSVFQYSDVGGYKMHAFTHNFAEFLSSQTCWRLDKDKWPSSEPLYKKVRHLSLSCDRIKLSFFKEIVKCEGLRTLLVLSKQETQIGQLPRSLFQKLKRLRALDLSHTDIQELPKSLGQCRHLRYLDVSETMIRMLPSSASNLHRLEVLKLKDCVELVELPKNLSSLTNLRHLDVDMKRLNFMPKGIGSLIFLQTLPSFIVCKETGCNIIELRYLKLLRGAICLCDLGQVKDGAEARDASICDKPYLQTLKLEWYSGGRGRSRALDIFTGLQPHSNVKDLEVINYGGSTFPAWITSPSCMLVSIYVQYCWKLRVLPSLGELPFLKRLHIEGLNQIKDVDYRFCGERTTKAFPSLESLKILNMFGLKRWYGLPENSMPQLRNLIVKKCPKLSSIQSLKNMNSLLTLEISHCPALISLPELPDAIQSLIIKDCDVVKQICLPVGVRKWFSIEAIPYVEIDGIVVNGGSS